MAGGKRKILIVDDDEDFSISVKALLESEGYQAVVARSGEEGLRRLVEHRPDALVLDVMMETVEEGYGVYQAIQLKDLYQEYRDIPVVMVSSLEEKPEERFPDAKQKGMKLPKVYMTKPIDVIRFLEVVQEAVASKK